MRLGSLCSGAGSLDLAVEQVFGAETVWHCELPTITEKDGRTRHNAAVDVLSARWPGVPNHGDLIATDWAAVEPVDIMCAGRPCQPWSAAGKRKGAADERAIWPFIADAVRVLRPRIIVLENVATVARAGELERVANSLARIGYDLRWTCLRASDVGAPHQRKRIFILAELADAARDRRHQGWPEPAWQLRGSDAAERGAGPIELLPTPSCADGGGGHLTRSGDRGGELLLPGVARAHGNGKLLPTPTARDHKGHNQRQDETCLTGALLPTPNAADSHRGPDLARENRDGSGGDDLQTIIYKTGRDETWGKYALAIHRWEQLTRSAPSPTEPNRNGNPRLNPAFSEWMMGWPAGWVTDVPGISRNDQLRIIGNGVVVMQAVSAFQWLLNLEVAA